MASVGGMMSSVDAAAALPRTFLHEETFEM